MADEVAKCLDLSYGTVSFVLKDEQKEIDYFGSDFYFV